MADANSNILDAIAADPNVSDAFKDGIVSHRTIDIVFDGPPGPEAGRFVEVESPPGTSIKLGEWIDDGEFWRLRFMVPTQVDRQKITIAAKNPRVIDNDRDEITVTLNGKELRGWSYSTEPERRVKMLAAREYVEGYCDGRDVR